MPDILHADVTDFVLLTAVRMLCSQSAVQREIVLALAWQYWELCIVASCTVQLQYKGKLLFGFHGNSR